MAVSPMGGGALTTGDNHVAALTGKERHLLDQGPAKAEVYEPPELRIRGTLNELTQGGSQAGNLDASYPVGTSSTYGGGLFS